MKSVKMFLGFLSAIGAAIASKLGILLPVMAVLTASMVIDYATGVLASKKESIEHPENTDYGWNSKKGRLGIAKKVGYLCVISVAGIADLMIYYVANAFGQPASAKIFWTILVAIWYILNECLSIIENAGRMGAPIPEWLRKNIAVLKTKVDSAGDQEEKDED